MIVSLLLWSLADSKTSLDELHPRLGQPDRPRLDAGDVEWPPALHCFSIGREASHAGPGTRVTTR